MADPTRTTEPRVCVAELREQLLRLSKMTAEGAEKLGAVLALDTGDEATSTGALALMVPLVNASAAAFAAATGITNGEAKAIDVGRGLRHDDSLR